MTREEFIKVYEFAKEVAKNATGPFAYLFPEAKAIAVLIENQVGQLSAQPAQAWKRKEVL